MAVSKIIEANLPRELSKYFLFDAMKTSELMKEEHINNLIKDNIKSVMGFNKYAQLQQAAGKLLGEEKAKAFMKDYVGNMRNLKDWLPDPTSKEYWRNYEYICVLQAYMTAALVTAGDIEK